MNNKYENPKPKHYAAHLLLWAITLAGIVACIIFTMAVLRGRF